MKLEGINPIQFESASYIEKTGQTQEPFTHWLSGKIMETNDRLNEADNALAALATGQANNLHQTMLTLEEAKLSLQFLEQIRNRLMSAYQDVLREQI